MERNLAKDNDWLAWMEENGMMFFLFLYSLCQPVTRDDMMGGNVRPNLMSLKCQMIVQHWDGDRNEDK